jgi:hypothetical protein
MPKALTAARRVEKAHQSEHAFLDGERVGMINSELQIRNLAIGTFVPASLLPRLDPEDFTDFESYIGYARARLAEHIELMLAQARTNGTDRLPVPPETPHADEDEDENEDALHEDDPVEEHEPTGIFVDVFALAYCPETKC